MKTAHPKTASTIIFQQQDLTQKKMITRFLLDHRVEFSPTGLRHLPYQAVIKVKNHDKSKSKSKSPENDDLRSSPRIQQRINDLWSSIQKPKDTSFNSKSQERLRNDAEKSNFMESFDEERTNKFEKGIVSKNDLLMYSKYKLFETLTPIKEKKKNALEQEQSNITKSTNDTSNLSFIKNNQESLEERKIEIISNIPISLPGSKNETEVIDIDNIIDNIKQSFQTLAQSDKLKLLQEEMSNISKEKKKDISQNKLLNINVPSICSSTSSKSKRKTSESSKSRKKSTESKISFKTKNSEESKGQNTSFMNSSQNSKMTINSQNSTKKRDESRKKNKIYNIYKNIESKYSNKSKINSLYTSSIEGITKNSIKKTTHMSDEMAEELTDDNIMVNNLNEINKAISNAFVADSLKLKSIPILDSDDKELLEAILANKTKKDVYKTEENKEIPIDDKLKSLIAREDFFKELLPKYKDDTGFDIDRLRNLANKLKESTKNLQRVDSRESITHIITKDLESTTSEGQKSFKNQVEDILKFHESVHEPKSIMKKKFTIPSEVQSLKSKLKLPQDIQHYSNIFDSQTTEDILFKKSINNLDYSNENENTIDFDDKIDQISFRQINEKPIEYPKLSNIDMQKDKNNNYHQEDLDQSNIINRKLITYQNLKAKESEFLRKHDILYEQLARNNFSPKNNHNRVNYNLQNMSNRGALSPLNCSNNSNISRSRSKTPSKPRDMSKLLLNSRSEPSPSASSFTKKIKSLIENNFDKIVLTNFHLKVPPNSKLEKRYYELFEEEMKNYDKIDEKTLKLVYRKTLERLFNKVHELPTEKLVKYYKFLALKANDLLYHKDH